MRCPTLKDLPPPPSGRTGWPWTEESQQLPARMPDGRPWPRISIVTPNYNYGRFIEETIRSVLLQGYPDLEYIVIDGASSDNSREIIRRYERWMTCWTQEQDRGQSDAINKGLRKATGEIINWLNSDDTFLPNIFGRIAGELNKSKKQYIVFGDCYVSDKEGNIIRTDKARYAGRRGLIKWWSWKTLIFQPAAFFYKSLLDEFGLLDETLYYAMDYDLWLRFSKRYNFYYIPEVMANYKMHPDAKTFPGNFDKFLPLSCLVSKRYWGSKLSPFYYHYLLSQKFFLLRERSKRFYKLAAASLNSSEYRRSLKYVIRSMLAFPPNFIERNHVSIFLKAAGDRMDFLLEGSREKIWRFYKSRPWRGLFVPLYPALFALGFLRRVSASTHAGCKIRKVLIFNFGAIGDNLMATSAIRALNEKFPAAGITIMTGSKPSTNAYLNNPRIKRVFGLQQFDAGNIKYIFGKKNCRAFDLFRVFICYPTLVIKVLTAGYDLGINFCAFEGGANFGNLLMYLCGIPKRAGAFGSYTELLTEKSDSNLLRERHWVDIYIEIVGPLGIKSERKNLEFFTSPSDEGFAAHFFEANNISGPDLLIAVAPGGGAYINNKRWPVENFAEVINRLTAKYTFKILIFGSRPEKELTDKFKGLLKSDAVSIVGFELNKAAALLRYIKVLLTNDSALLHLADAAGVPHIVSIFGPTDPKRIAPRNERNIYISPRIDCSPCIELDAGEEGKRCFKETKEACLKAISIDEVYKALEDLLDKLQLKEVYHEHLFC